jgi:hypothetical protein
MKTMKTRAELHKKVVTVNTKTMKTRAEVPPQSW